MRRATIVSVAVAAALATAAYVLIDEWMAPDGSTTLVWQAPTEDEEGNPLTNLAGFAVHCWNETGGFTATARVDDPSATSYLVEGLEPGEWLCSVSAIDEDGDKSALSNVISRSVH